MDLKKKISVIVPAYNAAPWINKCLDSIMKQTYKELEIIIIDDGSTDNTAEIIDGIAECDKRVQVIHQKNAGLVASREVGIKLSTGDYIGFVDADDTITSDMYERLLKNAIKYNADISHCGIDFCYSDGKIDSHYNTGKCISQNNFEGVKDLLEGVFIEPTLCNKLYKAELLYDSCLDKSITNNEDLLRNFVLFNRSDKNVYEDFCGYQYYQRNNSMSKNQDKAVAIAKDIMRARRMIVLNSSSEIRPYALRSWLSSVINAINELIYIDSSDAKSCCTHCRDILIKEKEHLHYLIKRQQIAAKLIIALPKVYKSIYSLYRGG